MPDNISDILGTPEEKVPVAKSPQPDEAKFTAEDFVQHVKWMEMISTRASEPIHRMWDRAWGLYNNSYDFSTKAQWQSKNFVPRINMTVRMATFMIKKALLGPSKPYTVQGYGDFGKLVAYYIDKLCIQQLEDEKYVTKVTDSLHAGLLSSLMVLKVYPVYINDESVYFSDAIPKPVMGFSAPVQVKQYKRLKIRIDAVDPYNIHLDPTGQNKFKIHDIEMDLYDLIAIAEEKDSGYDMDEIKKIQESFTKSVSETPNAQEEYRSGQNPDSTKQRRARTVFVQEFWGDVWTTDGKLVARNCTFAIANKQYLIKKPIINPLPDKKDPFVISPVIRKPFSVWHQGFAEVVAGIQIMMTELMNLILDANLFSSAKAFELDIDQVYDPLEFIQGIAPGKTYKKRGGGFQTAPMIREVQIGQVAQQSLSIYQALDREFQSGIGLNEFSMPTGRTTGSRTTATEVVEKSQSATTFMEEIAHTTEDNLFEPLLDKVFHNIVEYQINFEDPYTVELFGADEASKLMMFMRNPVFRNAMHKAPIKFKARGISSSMSKLRDLEKLTTVSNVIKSFPELAAQVDPQKAMVKLLEALSWYPQEILKEIDGPMIPPPSMGGNPLPQTPISGMGNLSFLGNVMNGMSQVPQLNGMGG